MAARRLSSPLHAGVEPGRPITIVVDGRPVPAFEGEPVAVALLAAGRSVLSRSFRLHRPRGLMCSTGQCGWCECRIDGRPSVRACRAPAREGLVVEGEHALPSVRHDLLGVLDRGAAVVPPTFYHHRFLRPKRWRKRYLDVIRWFGGRGRLTIPGSAAASETPAVGRAARTLETDVVVVGGGPAGLLAALGAAGAAARVVVLEAESAVGGPWRWRDEAVPGAGPLGSMLAALAATGQVTIEPETTALSLDDDGVHAVGPASLLEIKARAVVVASGSYERLPLVPGNDRPGVVGARAVEWLVRGHGVAPGERAVLVGEGPDLERAAAALVAAGGEIVDRVRTADLVAIDGRSSVTGVHHRGPGGAIRRVAADVVVVGDRAPAREFALAARGSDRAMPVLLAGAAAGQPIETDDAADAAMQVGRTAAESARAVRDAPGPDAAAGTASIGEAAGQPHPRAARAMACFCEDVRVADITRERSLGYTHPELLKRRTGALTGPCQGKYCGVAVHAAMGIDDTGAVAPPAPTSRPPARPVRLGDLVVGTPADRSPSERAGS